MDALEFAKELNRMCNSYETCRNCGLNNVGSGKLCDTEELEKAVPIVEQWSKEHPKVTNLDHVAEGLEKLGYEVDKNILHTTCPPHMSKLYTTELCRDKALDCETCSRWWDEEYKE